MSGAAALIAEAKKHVGMGEPNFVQSWYRERNGRAYAGNFAWCDAFVSYCAYVTGNHAAVCPAGDRAYTVYHAQDFQKRGQWHAGTRSNVDKAKPGDIVFFDWSGSDSIGSIDHVGIIIKPLGNGRVQTIEGNTSDKCLIKERDYSVIAGYGRPKYTTGSTPPAKPAPLPYTTVRYAGEDWFVPKLIILKRGDQGQQVKRLQNALNAVGFTPRLVLDGDFGPKTEHHVKALQARGKLNQDGEYGPRTEAFLIKHLKDLEAARVAKPAPAPAPKPATPAPAPKPAPAPAKPQPAPKPVPTPTPAPAPVVPAKPSPTISDVLAAIESLRAEVKAIRDWTQDADVVEE